MHSLPFLLSVLAPEVRSTTNEESYLHRACKAQCLSGWQVRSRPCCSFSSSHFGAGRWCSLRLPSQRRNRFEQPRQRRQAPLYPSSSQYARSRLQHRRGRLKRRRQPLRRRSVALEHIAAEIPGHHRSWHLRFPQGPRHLHAGNLLRNAALLGHDPPHHSRVQR